MEGKRFIHTLRLENFLSYGSEGEEIELQPLNVLIGSNTSGKSNLIEAIGILRATPKDLPAAFRQGGGISEFLWKGNKDIPIAKFTISVDYPKELKTLFYSINFTKYQQKIELLDEEIKDKNYTYFDRSDIDGNPSFTVKEKDINGVEKLYNEFWDSELLELEQSILAQVQEARKYPEITYIRNQFSQICIYRDLPIGRHCEPRKPQQTDLPEYPLLEDGSNLGLVLNNLQNQIGSRKIIEKLKKFYDAVEELNVRIYGGTVQIFIREEGLVQPIPATRLSDGTLRYLFLIALLLDPTPPPLICLEEPEIGLHPDILPTIAEMLIEASQRTQLIVTTHSDALVSALSEYPESVLVCERDEKGSHLRRLEPDQLKNWLENYTLGDLWRMGEIGGNRW
ncbi:MULTISPECIES: AAA family ATPase [unclassified Tolypothrix]|uniref:AAA family ATPase n=1 Tax=unclassified Tolypothrix TaxID=2649714 RepID=UPI0005EAA23C|nr:MULTISPECIES: AAA family ATPase [unclassified Tolypothrix]BAY88905.1 putative ABC transporter ATP-binding protein [Microchaete diplosiphon NIES-3275]EKF03179.1 RecF/RecN/SMC protein [Tolypothrix sp. PCC 7601]MBE9084973.1 AAA family ATPase [Tolypothrix sp. LEGE 11397]UYD29548.1 AAA family ATPase [Tolypothrix sp. PCC 7712]UYD34540.1 AAA family ATPase [Tolypothrix sp. PCC 7601]